MKYSNYPLYITLIYLVVSVLWIAFSDAIVFYFPETFHMPLQLIKGWLFVCITASLIFFLLKREKRITDYSIHELQTKNLELDAFHRKNTTMLDALPVAIIEVDFSAVKAHLDQALKEQSCDLESWFNASHQHIDAVLGLITVRSIDGAAGSMFEVESPDSLINDYHKVFNRTSVENIKNDIIKFYRGENRILTDTELVRFDGLSFEASTFATIPSGYEDSWERIVVIVEDTSEKITAMKAVNSFFDLGVNLHMIADLNGKVHRANQGWTTALGYKPEELEGAQFLDLVHPEDIEKTINEMASLDKGVTTFFFENRYRAKDGEYHLLTWSAKSPSESKLIYAVATDITQQRLAEEQLHRAASIVNSTSEGTMVTDLEGYIQDVNPSFTQITGFEKGEVIGQKASILSSGRHDRDYYQTMWKSLFDEGKWKGEIWNRTRRGEVFPEYLTINRLTDNNGRSKGYVGVFSDISEMKKTQDTILKLSTQDALTALPNWSVFTDRLIHSIEKHERKDNRFCILSVDIDNFKLINESLGFETGDELIIKLADRLKRTVRKEDTVARIGGDEFKVLIEDIKSTVGINQVIDNLQRSFKEPFVCGDQSIHLTGSIGVSTFPEDGQTYDVLVRNADTALSQAKQQGISQCRFYSQELTEHAMESIFIENALRQAVEKDQLFLLYQPQFDAQSHRLVGLEALIRWQHPEIGVVSPMKFIPVAERTGLIQEIGQWVVETACRQGKQWLDTGYDFGRIAVNVSSTQIAKGDLTEVVEGALSETGFNPELLELEVTESLIMKNAEQANITLSNLRRKGIRTAIDDFGTGYSSLSYLRTLPIDKLKIDRSFVNELANSHDGIAIVDAIIAMAKALDLTVIAEGVEYSEQEAKLVELGCHQIQGFLYSQPVQADEIESTYLADSNQGS